MKLYTEEAVKAAYDSGYNDALCNHINNCNDFIEELNYTSKSIELPSDEEIEAKVIEQDIVRQQGYCHCFIEGAKWMKEQILNQNK